MWELPSCSISCGGWDASWLTSVQYLGSMHGAQASLPFVNLKFVRISDLTVKNSLGYRDCVSVIQDLKIIN
jgi:hypothetical protein